MAMAAQRDYSGHGCTEGTIVAMAAQRVVAMAAPRVL